MKALVKILQAIGIALVGIGLIYGFSGSMTRELSWSLVGVLFFFVGWFIEKKVIRK